MRYFISVNFLVKRHQNILNLNQILLKNDDVNSLTYLYPVDLKLIYYYPSFLDYFFKKITNISQFSKERMVINFLNPNFFHLKQNVKQVLILCFLCFMNQFLPFHFLRAHLQYRRVSFYIQKAIFIAKPFMGQVKLNLNFPHLLYQY